MERGSRTLKACFYRGARTRQSHKQDQKDRPTFDFPGIEGMSLDMLQAVQLFPF
jgi:hypothetical protein